MSHVLAHGHAVESDIWIGLGANLGDPVATLQAAVSELGCAGFIQIVCSSVYRTAPIESSGPDYFNAVVKARTRLDAHEALQALQAIESTHGRTRPYRNAPRTLDVDILLFGSATIHDSHLTVPHPRMHLRAFVLAPMHELDSGLHLSGEPITTWLDRCQDQAIERISALLQPVR